MKHSIFTLVSFFLFSCAVTPSMAAKSKPAYTIQVNGGDESSFLPTSSSPAKKVHKKYDVVVVGGGLAGLMSAIYLSDQNKTVLLLEKEAHLGGLAQGSDGGVRYDRGAAYWTDAYKEEQELLNHIGLGDYEDNFEIPEPIDSYYWNGHLYKGIWDAETLKELPSSFELFMFELQRASDEKLIPDQPFEEFEKVGGSMELDQYTTADWMAQMPGRLDRHIDLWTKTLPTLKEDSDEYSEMSLLLADGLRIQKRFAEEKAKGLLDGQEGMGGVIGLMDLYCRSALGTTSNFVSAMAFANFYISEIVPRYTTPVGTAYAALNMEKMLTKKKKTVTLMPLSPVKKITQDDNGVEVTYQQGKNNFVVSASYAIFAAQLKLAPKVVEGLSEKSPEQAELMTDLGYSNYSVHVLTVQGHPYRSSYDTWTRAPDYSEDDFTDVILGLWMQPKMLGYDGFRDFTREPPIKNGVLTIYHPLAPKWLNSGYTDVQAREIAQKAIDRLESLYSKLPNNSWRGPLKILSAETNRWPLSVHVAVPGHYSHKARILRKPFGRVFFGNNNLGTPAFEEAIFRGHCAANNVLKQMNNSFVNEDWSRCPLD